jgi:hypothetical protein
MNRVLHVCAIWVAGLLCLLGLATQSLGDSTIIEFKGEPPVIRKLKPAQFPITITTPGSFKLGKNITVPDADTTAIKVMANDVIIDLNGFAIRGPTVCSGCPDTSCSPTGTGLGIDASGYEGTIVKNGVIRGMGNHGIYGAAIVEDVIATSNGQSGIQDSGVVDKCVARLNGYIGIDGRQVTDSRADCNANVGIVAQHVVTNSSAALNGNLGISSRQVTNCVAEANEGGGIGQLDCGGDPIVCSFSGMTVTGSTAFGNTGDGIVAYTVANSTALANTGVGIRARTATGCAATDNAQSQISADGIDGHNMCDFSPCP